MREVVVGGHAAPTPGAAPPLHHSPPSTAPSPPNDAVDGASTGGTLLPLHTRVTPPVGTNQIIEQKLFNLEKKI